MPRSSDISLLRLVAQRIAGPGPASPAAAVGHLTAMQAQDLPGALTSTALRMERPDRSAVIDAFNAGKLIRSWPMRGTLHLMRAVDTVWMMETLGARGLATAKSRRAQLNIDDRATARAQDVALEAIASEGPRSRRELFNAWDAAGQSTAAQRGVHLLAQLCQLGTLCLGPMRGKEQLVVATAEWIPNPRRLERPDALQELAQRYFHGHGPATVKDFARWAQLTVADAKAGAAAARGDLEALEADGTEYLMAAETPALLDAHRTAARGVFLLPGFDEIVLGYADRSMTVAPGHSDLIVPGGNGMFKATIIRDGQAIGTWKRAARGAPRAIEPVPFDAFNAATSRAIQQAYTELLPALE